MKRALLLNLFLFISIFCFADTIIVKDIIELNRANKIAKPGDIIILQDAAWKNVTIKLDCTGTKDQPIIFKAQTAGKVFISGKSQLKFGGDFITVDGLYFIDGYAGKEAVVDFRIDKKQLANNCRLTNCVINDFNNPKRMDENYWVSLSGKNNRIDHCSFLNKNNMGVLMAVILDDERSRENFHSIDHNYFGVRLPLASNSGEMIRVGVSQHCEFNSNTQIIDNFFENCDGETEIVSIKSCSNIVSNNLFKECQGGVVLRHGNYNTVENNIFLGNGKAGTGGVRIINKGQWVVNNLFYQCRGVGFRSPLSVMNGVPNSPAFRYVPVTDAVVANNSFYNCTPISLCEGSDTERTVSPSRVFFENNIFFNDRDGKIYNAYDDISGFNFKGNAVNTGMPQALANGFIKTAVNKVTVDKVIVPNTSAKYSITDSLRAMSNTRIKGTLSNAAGFSDVKKYLQVKQNAYAACGAKWFSNLIKSNTKATKVNCKTADEIAAQLLKPSSTPITIILTGDQYQFTSPLTVTGNITITSNKKQVWFKSGDLAHLFEIRGGNSLSLSDAYIDLAGSNAKTFISSDVNGSSGHSNFNVINSNIKNFNSTLFNAVKYTIFDSIIIHNSFFTGIKGTIFDFTNETDKKGYYDVEKLKITNNTFSNNTGQLLNMLRGGNDESTMGPLLVFKSNMVNNNTSEAPLIKLYGTQLSFIENNTFVGSNTNNVLLQFEDAVRAVHIYRNNIIKQSGNVITNKFVEANNNIIK